VELQWLPNQLQAVLDQMQETAKYCEGERGVDDIMELVQRQQDNLRKEVTKFCGERDSAASED